MLKKMIYTSVTVCGSLMAGYFGYQIENIPGAIIGAALGIILSIASKHAFERLFNLDRPFDFFLAIILNGIMVIPFLCVTKITSASVIMAIIPTFLSAAIAFFDSEEAIETRIEPLPDEKMTFVPAETYKERKDLAGGRGITRKEWIKILDKYGHRCLRCGAKKDLAMDHVIPLILGGEHDITNIQPLCKSCNSAKGGRYVDFRPYEERMRNVKEND